MLVSKLAASKSLAPVYVQDVFKTSTYTGTGASRTITTNVDLANDGGLVWIKQRDNADRGHVLFDTLNDTYFLTPSGNSTYQTSTAARTSAVSSQVDFLSTGFDLGTDTAWSINNYYVGNPYVAWSFKRQPKFFDVVKYTGTGVTNTQDVSHNLEATPGFVITKCISAGDTNWNCWHKAATGDIYLNLSLAQSSSYTLVTGVSSTTFSVRDAANSSSETYIAYVFADDAGGFGTTGTDSVIKCGSYVGSGSTSGPTVTLGFEPQWILIKSRSNTNAWYVLDSSRGFNKVLQANSQMYELSTSPTVLSVSSTGFQITTNSSAYNQNGQTYIYVAIAKES